MHRCTHTYARICTCAHTHMYAHTQALTDACTHMHGPAHTCPHACTHMCTHRGAPTRMHAYAHMHTHAHVPAHTCTHRCMHTYARTCTRTRSLEVRCWYRRSRVYALLRPCHRCLRGTHKGDTAPRAHVFLPVYFTGRSVPSDSCSPGVHFPVTTLACPRCVYTRVHLCARARVAKDTLFQKRPERALKRIRGACLGRLRESGSTVGRWRGNRTRRLPSDGVNPTPITALRSPRPCPSCFKFFSGLCPRPAVFEDRTPRSVMLTAKPAQVTFSVLDGNDRLRLCF